MLYTVTIEVHVTAVNPHEAERLVVDALKGPGVIAVTPKKTELVGGTKS